MVCSPLWHVSRALGIPYPQLSPDALPVEWLLSGTGEAPFRSPPDLYYRAEDSGLAFHMEVILTVSQITV